MKIRTSVKAGGMKFNHNETLVREYVLGRVSTLLVIAHP